MNIITKIVFFIFIVFTLNIIIYYISEDYRFFIKKIKNKDKIIYIDKININDTIKSKVKNIKNKVDTDINIKQNNKNSNNINKTLNYKEEILKKKINIKKEIILGKSYKDIINLFSKYKLKKIELETSLFDLTDEYPDYYYEYYSKDITLYFFTSKTYEEVKDIMKVISYDVPYNINETNNFMDKSFYLNLKGDLKDNIVRIVIKNKNVTFGLKIKKNLYNDIKKLIEK